MDGGRRSYLIAGRAGTVRDSAAMKTAAARADEGPEFARR
jgi:hypothetical protein